MISKFPIIVAEIDGGIGLANGNTAICYTHIKKILVGSRPVNISAEVLLEVVKS